MTNNSLTVSQWIEAYKDFYPNKIIRIIDSTTGKGTGTHWIIYKDFECLRAKITKEYIFLYV